MMKMSFNYFVSYVFEKDTNYGFSSCKSTLDEELNDWETLCGLSQKIAKDNNFDKVAILNWKKLK